MIWPAPSHSRTAPDGRSVGGALAAERLEEGTVGPGILAAAVADFDELDAGTLDVALFDQGLAGFLLSAEAPDLAYVSVVFLPKAPAGALRATAVARARFAPLLAAQYSANAYPFSVRYQNCNQWVAELLATAWAPPDERATAPAPALRGRAQAWLQQTGYAPRPVTIDSHLTRLAAGFVPLVHLDDHP